MNKQTVKTYLLCAAATLAMAFVVVNIKPVWQLISTLLMVLRPFFIGSAIAFVLFRPYKKIQQLYGKFLKPKLCVSASLLSVYLLLFAICYALIAFVLPQLAQSISLFTGNLDGYYKNLLALIQSTPLGDEAFWVQLNLPERINVFMKQLPDILEVLFSNLFVVTSSIVSSVVDVVLGFVISIYLLIDQKSLALQLKKLLQKTNPSPRYSRIVYVLHLVSNTFSSFINGQLTEACILGILCFIGMNIFGFAYASLISIIIGITNLIPIVGPIIGSIPCIFILLLVNPIDALWFLVFIIVLQQLESNLIYPRVVGSSVGLPALWVMLAVVVGGGLFGILGMILGIPTLSVLYKLFGDWLEQPSVQPPAPIEENQP